MVKGESFFRYVKKSVYFCSRFLSLKNPKFG